MIGTLDQRYREVTIVGAGIAGMLAAYTLDRRGYRVTLLEKSGRAGGLIQTTRTDCGIAESAAHSLIATSTVRALCNDLGVELLDPRKESSAKYILRNGTLRRFPLSLPEAIGGLRRAAFQRSESGRAQNLDAWGRKHLGDAAADYLLTPFVRGIYGVQPAELGVATAFPFLQLPEGETLFGTLLRRRFKRSAAKEKKHRAAPRFGMGDLVSKLEQRLDERLGNRFRRNEKVDVLPDAGNVMLATPAPVAAGLLQPLVPQLAEQLHTIRYTPIVSVTTFVERSAFTHPVNGVGVLMPSREETKSLGMLFNSSSFGDRVQDENRLASLTVMLGGTAHSEWLNASDAEIRQAIKFELFAFLGIREPYCTVIHRWPKALPQYSVDLPTVWQKARDSWCIIPGRLLSGNYTGQISLRGMIEDAVALN